MKNHIEAIILIHKLAIKRLLKAVFSILGILLLFPLSAYAKTSGSFSGGYKSCYQYGVDQPSFTINYVNGTATQIQVQIDYPEETFDGGTSRYVFNGSFSSPYIDSLIWGNTYDGTPARPWHVTKVRYYTSADGSSADDTVSFIVQDSACTGGGGGSSTTPEIMATSSINQVQSNIWQAWWAFFASMIFMIWLIKSRAK